MKHILSYGGGVNSTALYFLLREKGLPLDEIIFADTGSELPETYPVVEKFRAIVEKDGAIFTTVKSPLAESLYAYCFERKTIPFRIRRDCTDKFKIRPIRKYLRERYGKEERFTQYIGIAKEEAHRIRDTGVKYMLNEFPLVWEGIDREGCKAILKKNGFNKVVKSGCFFCPYTKKASLLALMKEHPELYEKAIELEENCDRKGALLFSLPLRTIRNNALSQRKLTDFPHTCDIAGSCFL